MYVQLYVDISMGVDVLLLVQFNTTDWEIFICTPTKIEHAKINSTKAGVCMCM